MADPIISEQDVVDKLGRGDASDAGLSIAVSVASDVVRTFTEQTITLESSDTATLDGSGGESLLLPERPVTRVREVTVDGTAVTDYVLNANGVLFRGTGGTAGESWLAGTWPEGRQNVSVTYDHGYASADIPADLAGVAIQLAERLWVQGPAVSEQMGQTSVRYAGAAMDLTPTERFVLAKYRQVR